MDTHTPLEQVRDMRAPEFREALEELERSGQEIGRFFGAGERTGRRWQSGEMNIPPAVATLVRMLVALKRKDSYSNIAHLLREEALYMEHSQRKRDLMRASR
jgi:hypothetical protein